MGFRDAIGEGFFNYGNFDGRASRAEYWWWMLFTILSIAAAAGLDLIAFPGWTVSPFALLVLLAAALPALSVTVRRLHDSEHSGWWVLFSVLAKLMFAAGVASIVIEHPLRLEDFGSVFVIVPLALIAAIGAVLIVMMLLPGSEGNNRFGPNRYAGL